MAHKMGIKSDLPMVPSIALGTASLSLKELAGAYASFVNDSRPVQPYFITRIEDRFGNEIVSFEKPDKLPKVYSDNTRQTMVSFMEATVNEGTATRLRYKYKLNNQIAGKTGTTQDNRDAWFVGITPKLVTVTWVGNDNHRIGFNSTYVGQGANAALPMFGLFYQNLNKDKSFDKITKARFEYPSEEVTAMLECEERYEPTFLERLFGGSNPDHIQLSNQNTPETPNTNMEQTKEPEKKEKKGFFSFLKRKKKK
jgi:penicillin-binding protein 1A